MIAIREIATGFVNVAPSGLCNGFIPNAIAPTNHELIGMINTAKTERLRLTLIFCNSNRARGTGDANKYLRVDHDASDATVSPLNSAITVTKRNGVAK